jgi:hypothetical protein
MKKEFDKAVLQHRDKLWEAIREDAPLATLKTIVLFQRRQWGELLKRQGQEINRHFTQTT